MNRNVCIVFGLIVAISLLSSCGTGGMQESKTYRFKNTKLTVAAPSGWIITPEHEGNEKLASVTRIYFQNKLTDNDSEGNQDLNDKNFIGISIGNNIYLDNEEKYDEKTAIKYNNVYVSLKEPHLNESDKIEDKANLNSFRDGYIYITKSKAYPISCLYRDNGKLPFEYEAIFNSIVIEED